MDARRTVTLGLLALLVLGAWSIVPRLRGPRVAEGPPLDLADPTDVPDPTESEPLPEEYRPHYRTVVPRDRITPIYLPTHRTAEDTDWPDDTLVLGVTLDGHARAYPVRVLNRREMVLDRLGATPILATW